MVSFDEAVRRLRQADRNIEADNLAAWVNKDGQRGGWDGYVRKLGLADLIWL